MKSNTNKTYAKPLTIAAWIRKILALGGFHMFLFTLGITHPLVLITCAGLTTLILLKVIFKKNLMKLMVPLASGLLVFLLKLLYWDRWDLRERVEILLFFTLLYSLVLVFREFNLLRRFFYRFNRLPLKKRLAAIFIVTEILFIIASVVIVQKGVKWGGDEPHYLVISQSLAQDFDLNVFDQYARDRYRDFVEIRLTHHARVGKGFKVWYSYGHLPGLSATLAPFFLVKLPIPLLYVLVRAYLGLFGALLAVVVYLFALKLWKHRNLAFYITMVLTLTAPVFFYSIHIFAELQACLLILASLYLLLYSRKPLLAGFLLGLSVFWGMKYAIFIYIFSGIFFIYYVFKKQHKRAILFVLFPVLLQVVFFGYLYYAYGNFNPMSIYNGVMTPDQVKEYEANMQQIPMVKRVETLIGMFFDQRDGLLLYSPFYLLAFPGLILALIQFKKYWREIIIAGAGLGFILFLGYSTVRPGYCPQARYLVPVVWVMMLFAVIYYREAPNPRFKRLFYYLPVYGILVTFYQVMNPFTLYQSATHANLNRPGLMFQQWSNIHLDLSSVLPSFVKVPGNFQYLPNIVFLLLFVSFILLALKKVNRSPIPGGRTIGVPLFLTVLFIGAVLFPRVPTYNPILQKKEDAEICKIYGQSVYPTRTAERKFELIGDRDYHYTISTLKPAQEFILEFENHGDDSFEVEIYNFDRQREKVTVEPTPRGTSKRISIKKPRYKAKGKNLFYRIHIQLTPAPPQEPTLYLQLYPKG
jgi:hypothetical protein